MVNRFNYCDIVWVDLVDPSEDEIKSLIDEFHIHLTVAEELSSASYKPRSELFGDHLYLILHFPVFKHSHKTESKKQEIDFVIGRNFLITARYDTIDAIEKFSKMLEVNAILNHGETENCTSLVFFGIINEIYRSLDDELSFMTSWISKIEREIFEGKEREMVAALSNASRNLLNFKNSINFHKDIFMSTISLGNKIFDSDFSHYMEKIIDEHQKLKHAVYNQIDSIQELRETNNSLLSTKQNEIMKILSVFASIGLPLSIIASLLQIDTISRPIVGQANDFWILLASLGIIGLIMFIFFKFKRWL